MKRHQVPGQICWGVAILLVSLLSGSAVADIIPATRRIAWEGNVGIPGGIPSRTTVFANVKNAPYNAAGDDLADDTSAIQAAFNACPSNQVVYIPAGVYRLNRGLTITNSYTTVRGAGPGLTVIDAYSSSNVSVFAFGPPAYVHLGPFLNVTNGAIKGSTNISLSTLTNVATGCYLRIDELNDTNFVTPLGYEGNCTWCSRNNGTRCLGQIVEVTSINGNSIGFNPPIYWTYQDALLPQVCPFNAGIKYAGVEDLTVRCNNTGYSQNFRMEGAAYCWLRNVEGDYADGDHADIYNSFRCEVRDSYFHDGFKHTSGQADTDVMLATHTSACLIENNIFWRLHASVILNWGAAGNVIGYNYLANNFDQYSTNATMQDMSAHGAHPMFNLWEGNFGVKFDPDSIWGSSSHGTVFRNVFTGVSWADGPLTGRGAVGTNGWYLYQKPRAICLESSSWYYNIVGNVLGCSYYTNSAPHPTGVYMLAFPQVEGYETPYIFMLGYVNPGGTNGANTNTAFTTLIHGNWDWATQSRKWDPGIVDTNLPSSCYLTGKPVWFGDRPWPPIEPSQPLQAVATNLPAGYRLFLMNPDAFVPPSPASPSGTTPPTTGTVKVTDGVGNFTGSSAGSTSLGAYNLAQKFTAGASFDIREVLCRLSRTGSPAFDLTCSIYTDNPTNHAPWFQVGMSSSPVNSNLLTTNESTIAFTNLVVSVTNAATYWLVLRASTTSSGNTANWYYVPCAYDSTGTIMSSVDGTTWNAGAYAEACMFTPYSAFGKPAPPPNLRRVP
jgi:hypothetical protein